jgi:protocatechuate 3,4-dioxygenase beta subunit
MGPDHASRTSYRTYLALLVAIVAGFAMLARHRHHAVAAAPGAQPRASLNAAHTDSATIDGDVVDAANAPLAGVTVCARTPSPVCAISDATGAFAIGELDVADVRDIAVAAQLAHYTVEAWQHTGSSTAQHAHVVIAMSPGGAAITGVVRDAGGHMPLARAMVVSDDSIAQTDRHGAYTLWVKQPDVNWVAAYVDGYAMDSHPAFAPAEVDFALLPEATLAGRVIDAAGKPVPHVLVWARGDGRFEATSDDDGRFRFTQLMPDVYQLYVSDPHAISTRTSSLSVAVGEHVEGVIVHVVPAFELRGRVVIDASGERCANPSLVVTHGSTTSTCGAENSGDGRVDSSALLPGTYQIYVTCDHELSSEHYADVVITDHDVVDQTWTVTAGGSITGTAIDSRGRPIAGVRVEAGEITPNDSLPPAYDSATTGSDGSFVLTGLRSAPYQLTAAPAHGSSDDATPIIVDVLAGHATRQDIVVDDSASELVGHVRFADGSLATRIDVKLIAITGSATREATTDDSGRFTASDLRGDFRVKLFERETEWPLADAGTVVHLAPGSTNELELTTTKTTGEIRGHVIDELGGPVDDAFVAIEPYDPNEPGAFLGAKSEVVVDGGGNFRATKLTETSYRVRAYRKSGGETSAQPVALGGEVTLTLASAGTVSGVVRLDGAPVQHFTAALTDLTRRYDVQTLDGFALDGRFAIHGVAAGRYRLTITAEGGAATATFDVRAGRDDSIDLDLDLPAHVRGRVVSRDIAEPLESVMITVNAISGTSAITDVTGRFDLVVPRRGPFTIAFGTPTDLLDEHWSEIETKDIVVDRDTIELGDIPIGPKE